MDAHKSQSEAVATQPTLQDSTESAVKNDMTRGIESRVALEVEALEEMTKADYTATKNSASSMISPRDVKKDAVEVAINSDTASEEPYQVDSIATKTDISSQKLGADLPDQNNETKDMIKSEVSTVAEAFDGKTDPTATGNTVLSENDIQQHLKSNAEDDTGIDSHHIAPEFDKSDSQTDSSAVHVTGSETVPAETVENQPEDAEPEAAPIAEASYGEVDKAVAAIATLSVKDIDETAAEVTTAKTDACDSQSKPPQPLIRLHRRTFPSTPPPLPRPRRLSSK
jgi:hypothetical protein